MANGVEVRGNKLRIYFNYENEKCREPLGLDNTPENKAYAASKVATIRHEIQAGSFDYSHHFPNSKRLAEFTFGHYLQIWLKIKERQVTEKTIKGYERWCRNYITPKWGKRLIEKIDTIHIEDWISDDLHKLSSKSIKEIMQIMSQVFDLFGTRKRSHYNPTKAIKVALPDAEDPDVFSRGEIDRILSTPSDRDSEMNMAEFWLWTGPRAAELMAMGWDAIDLDAGTVRFEMGVVDGQYKATKNVRSRRTVELLAPALEALKRQHKITGERPAVTVEMIGRDNRTIHKVTFRPVWLNTYTDEPYVHIKIYREYWWAKHLEAAEVRYRGPSQCRHTFISQMLTIGMPINWIIAQVGHSTEAMIRKHYGTFINEDQPVSFASIADRHLGFSAPGTNGEAQDNQ
ncbi:Arm DNA-binding domain-containing protein [Maricurvus nonylphenolicus]|uniref:Arm DNA-binding domain-containing protein n=1 Tax=Maricurvus nonylphenolicus TaxID=1008307 RepID=UPI0036F1FCB9